jgi:iron complex outermembrane recepter protein
MYINRSAASIAALTFSLSSTCFAQSATTTTAGALVLEEVVVTGSRLATGFDTPTPVTMIDSEVLNASAPNNMGEALSQLPSLNGSVQNTTSGQGSANSNANGQNLLNLRNLGSDRTLILLDGQRMGVTNVGGSVDINIVPQSLVKRVDVVTGGASASYGSDAVAGVVNFVLDNRFEGLKVDVNYGQTAYHDAQNGKVSVAFGKQLSDRARVIGGVEYFKLNGLKWGDDAGRDWHTNPTMSVATGGAGGLPPWLLIPDVRSRYGTFGGTITAVSSCAAGTTGDPCRALVNQQFLPGGANAPLPQGTNVFGNNAFVTGGGGSIVNQAFAPTTAERKSLFLHGEFDVSDHVTLWAEGGYNASETFNQAQVLQSQTNNQFRIYEDNAFLPAAVKTILVNDPGMDNFTLTRFSRDMGYNEVTGNVFVTRFAAGVKGEINDRWSYDTILGYQDTHQDLDVRTAIMRNIYAAADAVVNPANGQIVCRSTIYATPTSTTPTPGGTGFDPGCVPLNVFGDGSPSQAAINYVMGLNTADIDFKQTTFDVNLRGNFGDDISLGAGPISFATGMNYRRLTAQRTPDPLSAIYKDVATVRGVPNIDGTYGGYSYYNPSPVNGRVSVTEGYVEFGVPLLRDLPGFQELSTTLAGRVTDYSQSGVKNMWKLGLNWTVNDSVRVRGTISADTRAPSVIELFNTAQVTRGTYTLPDSGLQGSGQNITTGNPNLQPEDARTYTAGFVFSPGFLPGFQASLDWYKIQLLGSIEAPGGQQVIDECYAGNLEFCSFLNINGVQGSSPSSVTGLTSTDFIAATLANRNLPADLFTSGLDFDMAYKTAAGPGDLNLRLTGLYLLDRYDPTNGCATGSLGHADDLVGAIGDCGLHPKIRARLSAKYDIGRFGMYVQERYIDKGKRNPNYVTGVDISDNEIPATWYTDLTFTYELPTLRGGEGEVYFNITNALDKDPPPTNSGRGRSWVDPTEQSLYDLLGRRYVLGARYKW